MVAVEIGARPWRAAMADALYGPGGFFLGGRGPQGHFRTSTHASPLFAQAIHRLARAVDRALGHPDPFDLVDVGAGRGELFLELLTGAAPPDPRWRLTAVELAGRPAGLPGGVRWRSAPPEQITGLVLANEWLDNVPVDVVELTGAGPRLLLVDNTGRESVGPRPGAESSAWLDRWWPLQRPGARAEPGHPRDDAWAGLLRRLSRGVAVAVDYTHDRAGRAEGAWSAGSLTGYRGGRQVPPVPDGSCDLTAHVALDAVAAAGTAAGATATRLTTQREALRELGVHGGRPPLELATRDPAAYVAALVLAGEAAELTDPHGLGGFGWLLQSVGMPLPEPLRG